MGITKGWNLHKEFDVVPGWKKMAIAAPKEGSLSLSLSLSLYIYIYRLSLHGRELHFAISFTFISEENHINGTPDQKTTLRKTYMAMVNYPSPPWKTMWKFAAPGHMAWYFPVVSIQVSLVKRGGEL